MFNPDSLSYWKNLREKQNSLFSVRSEHELLAKDFKDWDTSDIYGRIRKDVKADIPGVMFTTRGFLVNFLLCGYIAFPFEISRMLGGASRHIHAFPVEHPRAESFLRERLFLDHKIVPAVAGTTENISAIRNFTDEVLSIARMFDEPGKPLSEATRELVESAFSVGQNLRINQRRALGLPDETPTGNVIAIR